VRQLRVIQEKQAVMVASDARMALMNALCWRAVVVC